MGYNYRITDLQCALGLSQLKRLDEFIDQRRALARLYDQALDEIPWIRPIQKERVGCKSGGGSARVHACHSAVRYK